VQGSEFEDIIILETPYYKKLQRIYRETLYFKRYITIAKRIIQGNGFLKMLEQRDGKELVYLGRKIFSLQEDFVMSYLNYLTDESHVAKWETFFERYSKHLFEISEKFVNGEPNRVLIFEIVVRKLLRDILTKHTTNISLAKKLPISIRFGNVINQLFSYIRNSLSKNMPITDALIVNSYERIPMLPKCRLSEATKLLSDLILKNGLPEPAFSAISKMITTSYCIDAKEKIITTIKTNQVLSKDGISEIFSSYLFYPDDNTLAEILELLKLKARDMINIIKEKRETVEQRMVDIKQRTRSLIKNITGELVNLAENFSSEETVKNVVKKMQRNLITNGYDLKILKGEYQKYFEIQHEFNSIMSFKPNDLSKFLIRTELDPFVILIYNRNATIDDEQCQTLMKEVISEIKNDKAAMTSINMYRSTGFLKDKYNTAEIMKKYCTIIDDLIVPLVKSLLLEELIEYYPKLSGITETEGIRYLAEEALAGRVSLIEKDLSVPRRIGAASKVDVSYYRDLVSVLVYDIRGSTFMGTKLMNAKKESEIRNLFQESMLSIVEKYGGIPIKDTGDGGVIFFTANHYEIKNQKTIIPEHGSTLSVVRSCTEMIREAQNFVQENISRYKDWFKEAEERKINFEGATYATLPPSYRAIFQIGIGIASGKYPNEIYFDKNAYGEFDITGMLAREANFYSKVKAEEKSVVVCDDATLYNLLLNVEKFSFLSADGLRTNPLMLDTEQGLEYWLNQKRKSHGFILDLYKIFVARMHEQTIYPKGLKLTLGSDIVVKETGDLKDGKGGRGKFLFEIFSGEKV
jgi:class 3 adenylate cyclase